MPTTTSAAHLTVSDVAAASGCSPSAVRFYESHGLVASVRTTGNQRRFDESAPCRLKVAKLGQGVGLTVREIAAIFADLPPAPDAEQWARVSTILVAEAEARVDELRERLRELGSGAKLCEVADAW